MLWNEILFEDKVQTLTDEGFSWSIWRSPETFIEGSPIDWVLAGHSENVIHPHDPGAVVVRVQVETVVWAFVIFRNGGWDPSWKTGLIIGVAFVSAIIASVVLALHMQHSANLDLISQLNASREADSVLNHTLKNSVYSAVCLLEIEQQRELLEPSLKDSGELRAAGIQSTLDQLHRTIGWCSSRQVLIDLTSGTYQSTLSPINAGGFLRTVASTLTTCSYSIHENAFNLSVAVDEKMCRVALDNALTNAAAHGGDGEIKIGASFHPNGAVNVDMLWTVLATFLTLPPPPPRGRRHERLRSLYSRECPP